MCSKKTLFGLPPFGLPPFGLPPFGLTPIPLGLTHLWSGLLISGGQKGENSPMRANNGPKKAENRSDPPSGKC